MVATIFVERIASNIPTWGHSTKSPLLATGSPEAMLTVEAGEALMGPGLGAASNRVSGPITHAFPPLSEAKGILHLLSS